jgi:cyclopropane fatty-acyl-phospholipid synthase-like methyltransferase
VKGLPEHSKVLDLGCGCGYPVSRLLSRKFVVTGVDISDVQIKRARELVPSAEFRRADMTRVRFPSRTFGAVVSLYAIIHVPLEEQYALFQRIYRWITPGGFFLTTLGAGRYKGVEKGWLGTDATMFWDHEDADTYQRWLEEIGFVVELREFVPEGEDSGHELFRLRRPESTRGTSRSRRGERGGASPVTLSRGNLGNSRTRSGD